MFTWLLRLLGIATPAVPVPRLAPGPVEADFRHKARKRKPGREMHYQKARKKRRSKRKKR